MPIKLEADREARIAVSPRAADGSQPVRGAASTREAAPDPFTSALDRSRSPLPGGDGASAAADATDDVSGTAEKFVADNAKHSRAIEQALEERVRDADMRMLEMRHRITNSLQIIGSILQCKIRSVESEEAREHLQDVHHRLMAVAAVQEQLNGRREGETVPVGPYLRRLCQSVARSTAGDGIIVAVTVNAPDCEAPASDMTSLGLIVTELLMNAVKHAFPADMSGKRVEVEFRCGAGSWSLAVSDNGNGIEGGSDGIGRGLGTRVVAALARKLAARIEVSSNRPGTRISLHRPT